MRKFVAIAMALTLLAITPVSAETIYLEGDQVPGYIENVIDPIIIPKDAPADLNTFASKVGENATLQTVVNALMFTGWDENGKGIYSYNQGLVQAKELGLDFDRLTAYARENGVNTLFTLYLRNIEGYVVTFAQPEEIKVTVEEVVIQVKPAQEQSVDSATKVAIESVKAEEIIGTVETPVFYSGSLTRSESQGKGYMAYKIEYEEGKFLLVMSRSNLDQYLGQEVGIDTLGTKESFSIINTYIKQGDEFVKVFASNLPEVQEEGEKTGLLDSIFGSDEEAEEVEMLQEATGAEVLPEAGMSWKSYIIFGVITALGIILYFVFRPRRPYY